MIRSDVPLETSGDLRYQTHLEEAGKAPAAELWERVRAPPPLLDLGGGSGVYARAFPGPSLVADQAPVLALRGGGGLALDLLADPYPAGQGTVLLCNVLHLFGPGDCQTLVTKAAGVARTVIVKDLDAGTLEGALFALNMALYTREGDVHSEAALRGFFEGAGLAAPRLVRLRSAPASLVLASP